MKVTQFLALIDYFNGDIVNIISTLKIPLPMGLNNPFLTNSQG
ncbi:MULTISPECIES: hypothetical protein [Nitrosopumilus]|nr:MULTISPECIES: hypothetical protein [Nitrosopumilus]